MVAKYCNRRRGAAEPVPVLEEVLSPDPARAWGGPASSNCPCEWKVHAGDKVCAGARFELSRRRDSLSRGEGEGEGSTGRPGAVAEFRHRHFNAPCRRRRYAPRQRQPER